MLPYYFSRHMRWEDHPVCEDDASRDVFAHASAEEKSPRAASPASTSATLHPCGQCPQSPLAKWFAEPSSFELVATDGDTCTWQHRRARAHSCASVLSSSGSVASSTPIASANGRRAADDIASSTADQGKLSASAARRRRRRNAAAQLAVRKHDEIDSATTAQSPRAAPHDDLLHLRARFELLSAQLALGNRGASSVIRELRRSVKVLSFDAAGCRLVQDAMKAADCCDAAALASELRGHIWAAIESPYGNNVVATAIEVLPGPPTNFIADELRGYAAETAQHRFGCRIMSRLLEHTSGAPSTVALVDEALVRTGELCVHTYGHYVLESVLNHGQAAQKSRIAGALCSDLPRYSRGRNSTYIVKAALLLCAEADIEALADELLDRRLLLTLAQDQYGHHIVRALLKQSGRVASLARSLLHDEKARLQASYFGRRVLQDITQPVVQ